MVCSTKKVLIVDDEADVHEFVRVALEDDGYELLTASDGDAGLQEARTHDPDIVILDVQMPGKGGFEVFRELRQSPATAKTPVIMLTGVGQSTGMAFSAKDMGDFYGVEPEAFIDKPVDPAVLRETVRGLLQGPQGG